MADYKEVVKAILSGKDQVWLSGEGDLVDGVRLIEDALLTADLRVAFLSVVDGIPPPPPPSTDPIETFIVDTDKLNIRPTPSTKLTAIGTVVRGDRVEVQGKIEDVSSGFTFALLVSVNGLKQTMTGYVAREYLKPVPPPPPPPPPSQVVDYPRHTLHYIAGGNWDKVAGWLKQRKNIGKPVPGLVICSMGWSGEPLPEQAIAAGAMEVIWRDYPGGSTWGNWQDTMGSYQAGFNHVANCRLPGGSLDKTFIQIQNEPTSVGPGMANFYHGGFDAAKLRGIKIAYPVFSVGFPPLDFWASFVDVLRRGRDEGHRFTLHQYRAFWDQDGNVGTDKQAFINTLLNKDIALRHQQIFATLPDDLKNLPLALAEYFSRVATKIPLDWYRDAVKAVNAAVKGDPNLAWMAHWTYGHGGDGDWEISEVYDEKCAALFEV